MSPTYDKQSTIADAKSKHAILGSLPYSGSGRGLLLLLGALQILFSTFVK